MSDPSSWAIDVRPRHLPQVPGQHVGHAELEHPGGQLEAALDGAHVAELLQGEQDAARGGPGEAGGTGHGGQGHDRLARLEGAYHAETAGERLDEIRAGVAAWHAVLSVS
jgi:hypothetical protein